MKLNRTLEIWLISVFVIFFLTVDTQAGTTYCMGNFGDLYEIDTQTADYTHLGDLFPGNATPKGLAYNSSNDKYYTVAGRLWEVDVTTVTIAQVGENLGISSPRGLTYNESDGYLYMSQSLGNHLFRIDPISGNSTDLGAMILPGSYVPYIGGIAYDPMNYDLFVADRTTNSKLYKVNPDTRIATVVGSTGYGPMSSLAWNPDTQVLYGTTYSNQLISLNTGTGSGSFIGTIDFGTRIDGLTVTPDATVIPAPPAIILVAFGIGFISWLRKRRAL